MTSLLLIALVLPACLALPVDKEATRIVGGQTAAKGEYPHQISLQIYGQHICGGSIRDPTTIVTAAHCVYQMNYPLTVVAGINRQGESGGQTISVARYEHHESYEPSQIVNDIAVLHLASPLSYNQFVKPIALRSKDVNPGETLTLSGWGLTSAGGNPATDLQKINLRAIDLNTCADRLRDVNPVNTGNVCTESPVNQGACQGDSGGPLIDKNGKQIGVVSWGVPCALGKPDVFTSVPFFLPWVQSK